ncbi:Cytochrome bd-II oxidase subunit 1,cytochrome bd-II oxidase subunit 1,Bacterial Cytochrome Ubiquinol Oxidase [Chlamydia serpentis]|uniref:Cytochrome bd-II oxidase subunit 1,cytochrome bd-II oxidase subunit 1,Bacterial Cytochrome Ubiquinol Oxidase n=1 Tax=Chlamydia serpentis TaxID=1967782 RepID=A0A2R8FA19_9CHLA|nr:cytochrome ubiquinol oxidase subunit I [Chlamydia serpentis]SPN73269.1 Cytochrome bd-II oxidase subunit 1,cytochrome bd-II oxidase subunit 1,Bacterial Cytochrome Ubiquinol Oxidase [Chlamydia serpentis]
MDAVILSRIQFGLFIAFHYLFVPLSMGLSMMLVIMEGFYLVTKKKVYEQMTWFWVGIFALTFVLGVVTGIMQIFSFGSNWANFSEYTGNIFGTLLGSEGVFAFFLESGFLGILLFGRYKVSKKMHFFATCMVALGAHMSAFWIICANSWMQTPSGYEMVMHNGKLIPALTSFWKVVFSPTTIDRFIHAVLGTWLSGIFLVIGVSAYYLWKKRHDEFAKKGIKLGSICAAIVLVLQLWSADVTARGVAKNQPAKLAAFEGIFKTKEYTPIWGFGYVDMEKEHVIGLPIPGALSFLVHRNIKTPVTGLDQIPKDEWPNVQVVFQLYHLMVMFWGIMIVLTVLAWFAYKEWRWALKPVCLIILTFSVLVPEICNQCGWCAAEMGRQPWVVQGLLKTKDAISPIVQGNQIIQSLIMFSLVFIALLTLFITILCKKIKRGPEEENDPKELKVK